MLGEAKKTEQDTREQKNQRKKIDRQTFKRILLTYRPYVGQMGIVLLAILATTTLSLIVPLMIPLVYDDALVHKKFGDLILYIMIMIIATLLAGLIGVGQTYITNRVGQYVMRDLRNKLYSHLQDMSLYFFTSMPTGEIQSRLSNDVGGAQSTVTDTFTSFVTNIATVIGAIIAMLYLNPLLTVISFIFLPFFLFFSFKVGNIRRKAVKETQQSLASLNAWMQETLSVSGVLLIKTFGRKKFAQSEFEAENQKYVDLSIRQQIVGRWFFMLMKDFFVLSPIILVLVAGLLIIYGHGGNQLTIGKLVAFITLQDSFLSPCLSLISLLVNVQGSLALFDRLFEYLDLPIEITDAPNALQLSPYGVRGKVAFKNVSFSYTKKKVLPGRDLRGISLSGIALKGLGRLRLNRLMPIKDDSIQKSGSPMTLNKVSFTIQPGQLVAIVGPSGAGKTTIMYLILRLYEAINGSIEIDGYNIKEIAMQSLSDLIGVVTQETSLFHASIRRNLLYVRPEATDAEMIAATKAAAIHDRILLLDDKYDTIVGERGYKLSGGEKQRLAIARVLLKNPRILILDEATSALDTKSERLIQDALKPLMKNRTTIAIAHRLSTILAADLILVIDKGKIVEQGTHEQLLKYQGAYMQLYQQQFTKQAQAEPDLLNTVKSI